MMVDESWKNVMSVFNRESNDSFVVCTTAAPPVDAKSTDLPAQSHAMKRPGSKFK